MNANVKYFNKGNNKPIYLNGKSVIIDEEQYKAMLKEIQELKLLNLIYVREKSANDGNTITLEELKKELGITECNY
ncbi:MAG: hypothetical protein ACI4TX_02210 [Christensenellales bacterium]